MITADTEALDLDEIHSTLAAAGCSGPRALVAAMDAVERLEAEVKRLRVRWRAERAVCDVRERELLTLKGPCRVEGCRLHYAHSGPCDIPA